MRAEYLEKSQVDDLLAYLDRTDREKMYLCVALMVCSGLRLSECHALSAPDLDLENSEAYLRWTKRDKPRVVPVAPWLVDRLRNYLKYNREGVLERDRAFARYVEKARPRLQAAALKMLPEESYQTAGGRTRKGSVLRAEYVHKELMRELRPLPSPLFEMKYYSIQRGIERLPAALGWSFDLSPHTLRHTFSRDWLQQGGDLVQLSQILGHSSVAITGDVYGRFNNRSIKEAYNRLMGARR